MDFFIELLLSGFNGLIDYLSLHVLTCLVPALFIAGAISTFVSPNFILKYFGPSANKWISYSIASVSGTILAVCSCTVLPLFGGIYKRGAGIGPAIAFLYSGPAINILAIVYTARLLGYEIGIARVIGAVIFAIIIGLIMSLIFRQKGIQADNSLFDSSIDTSQQKPLWKLILYFVILTGILVSAALQTWILPLILIVALLIMLWRWFTKDEIILWMKETWRFVKLIVPWLLIGVFIAGILKFLIPESIMTQFVGGNTLYGNFISSFLGMLMYFATLTEVPILSAFMELGMGKGPALALLLAGPALSIPSLIVLRNIMGWKRTIAYAGLVVIMATITGYLFGLIPIG